MAAAAAAASGGDSALPVLEYSDVVWDLDGRGKPVVLGNGSFGIVYAGMLHGQPVAIKAEVLRPGNEEAWMKAVRLHYTAIGTCPHIVAVRGIFVDREGGNVTHHIVMERLAGDMRELLLTRGSAHYGADMALRLRLLADVAGGLAYLHTSSVIHADVKPDNVLLTAVTPRSPAPVAKLADLGCSVQRRPGHHDTDYAAWRTRHKRIHGSGHSGRQRQHQGGVRRVQPWRDGLGGVERVGAIRGGAQGGGAGNSP